MNPRICFALLFFSALAFFDQEADAQVQEQLKEIEPISVNVTYPAKVAVPIQFVSAEGYVGPYDPMDPKGVLAAQHRLAKVQHQSNIEMVKSYIPPGVAEFLKKEGMKAIVKEGERFALMHPAETADLIGIVTKAKHLYHLGTTKVKKGMAN